MSAGKDDLFDGFCTKPPQCVLNAFIIQVQSVWLCGSLQREKSVTALTRGRGGLHNL